MKFKLVAGDDYNIIPLSTLKNGDIAKIVLTDKDFPESVGSLVTKCDDKYLIIGMPYPCSQVFVSQTKVRLVKNGEQITVNCR